ncbi:MAG: CHASE2 domain-containing protein [Thiohalomonadaceae bacterium]
MGRRGQRRAHLLLALAVLLLALLEWGWLGVLQTLEARFGDRLLQQHVQQQQPDGQLVLIDIDEASLEQLAASHGRYPWPRSVHAELLEHLLAQGPRAVLFDILFVDADPIRPDDDAWLAAVSSEAAQVFMPYVILQAEQPGLGLPLDEFGAALGFQLHDPAQAEVRLPLLLPYLALATDGRLGAINFSPDADGIGRHYPLYFEAGGWRLPSLAARAAQQLGYPLPEGEQLRLNWLGPAGSYPRVPFGELYTDLSRQEKQRPQDEFRDRIVIIGASATALHDLRNTPLSTLHPAAEIIATALDNLRLQQALHSPPLLFSALLLILLLLPLWWAFAGGISPLHSGLMLLLASPLWLWSGLWALRLDWLLPLLSPLLFAWLYYALAALHAYRQQGLQRRRSEQIFSRFLDPRVVRSLVASGEDALTLKSESRPITVLFSDIRGFTTLSEQHSAETIVSLLNEYFSRQVAVIFANGGTMDKFIGDAIMAFWGAPVDDAEQARHAVEAALQMAESLQRFKEDLGDLARDFDIGIGIHSGPAVVGFLGSANRLDYTAIGDTVNLASRIEGQTKGLARILISSETRALCGETFDFIDHGSYKVKGRLQAVQLFEPRRPA